MDQAGLAGAGAADDADGLAGQSRETDAAEALAAGPGIGQMHLIEGHGGLLGGGRGGGGIGHAHRRMEHSGDPAQAGQRPADKHHGLGQLHQLNEDLTHIVDQGDDVAAEQQAAVHLSRSRERMAMMARLTAT